MTALIDDPQPGGNLPEFTVSEVSGAVKRTLEEEFGRIRVRGEVGRGTFVCMEDGRENPALSIGDVSGAIDLGLNLPLYSEDPDLAGALSTLAKRRDIGTLLSYQPFDGSERHRRVGAEWIARHGLEVEPQQVVITGGAQHAITVVLSTLCEPGDTVVAEPLTYPGLRTAASLLGLEVAAAPMDAEGVEPEALEALVRETGARVLYCMPTLHNPTTATMSDRRREALADLARRCDLQVIEDDVHGLLAEELRTPLAVRIPERTHYIASTSKVLAGGLRVAFVAAPQGRVEQLAFAVAASLWALPPLSMEVAALWIGDGTADAVLERKRNEAAARQDLAARLLPAGLVQTRARSYFCWLRLPEPWRTGRFVAAARARGVIVTGAAAFTVGGGQAPEAVRVSLSAPATRGEVEIGLRVLADLLDQGPAPRTAIV